MKDFLIPHIKEKMDQFLIDNPSLDRNSKEYLKHYRKLNYQEKKEQYKAYQKDYRVKIKSVGDSRFIKHTNKILDKMKQCKQCTNNISSWWISNYNFSHK